MALPWAFKTDESFLEKIAIGATGTRCVFLDLVKQGHQPIELERASMSFKIWKAIKIKRIRVPDILCLRCSHRFESRAKTKMEITMSHSQSDPQRGWDAGLDDTDAVALVHCERVGSGPLDWIAAQHIQYVEVAALRRAWETGHTKVEQPKGSQEGFELRITWPASVASFSGLVTRVESELLQYRKALDGRVVTTRLSRSGVRLIPVVGVNDEIFESQIVASVVPVRLTLVCEADADIQTYLQGIISASVTDRYAAAKALGHFADPRATQALLQRVQDDREHIYVRVDSAVGLARQGQNAGMEFLAGTLNDSYLENRLEATIVLGEVGTQEAGQLLMEVVRDTGQHSEIRAGAAWALGEVGSEEALECLIESFENLETTIRIEAARALGKIAKRHTEQILASFPQSTSDQRQGIAWALGRLRNLGIDQIAPLLIDEDARHWVSYVLGMQGREALVSDIERLDRLDPSVYFATTVLWKMFDSWIYGLEEY